MLSAGEIENVAGVAPQDTPAKVVLPEESEKRENVGLLVQKETGWENYLFGGSNAVFGLTAIGLSSYELATSADSTTSNKIFLAGWGAGVGVGHVLASIALFRDKPEVALHTPLFSTASYLFSAGWISVGASTIVSGIESGSVGNLFGGSVFAAAGLGALGYTVYRDMAGAKDGKPGLLGSLLHNVAINPNGVSTTVQF